MRSVGELDTEVEQLFRFLLRTELGDHCFGKFTEISVNCLLCQLKAEPLTPATIAYLKTALADAPTTTSTYSCEYASSVSPQSITLKMGSPSNTACSAS